MSTTLEVASAPDPRRVDFAKLQLYHQACSGVPLVKSRNPMKQEYSLQCTCGMNLRLRDKGPAVEAFEDTAVDQQPRTLATGTFLSSLDGGVQLVAKRQP